MDLSELYENLAAGKYRQIVVLTGAGVSTASGIPDFRSPGGRWERAGYRRPDRCPRPPGDAMRSHKPKIDLRRDPTLSVGGFLKRPYSGCDRSF